jgi:hypothetical protein
VAQTLAEDNKSAILVTGYTDNTGNDSISTRRFCSRPDAVELSAIGLDEP